MQLCYFFVFFSAASPVLVLVVTGVTQSVVVCLCVCLLVMIMFPAPWEGTLDGMSAV